MSQSGFNLEKLKDVVKEGELAAHPELIRLLSNSSSSAAATTCKAHHHKRASTVTSAHSALKFQKKTRLKRLSVLDHA